MKSFHNPNWACIGVRIRSARLAEKMTLEQLAHPDLDPHYIEKLEQGVMEPEWPLLFSLAARLNLPLTYFMEGIPQAEPNTSLGIDIDEVMESIENGPEPQLSADQCLRLTQLECLLRYLDAPENDINLILEIEVARLKVIQELSQACAQFALMYTLTQDDTSH